jgi:hypothetical protein
MSERGVFAVDRGLFDHDCFADEPFTEREAWVWLISEASWRARVRRVGRVVVDLKRGQLAASLRFLADKWQWNKDAVDRYLARLRGRDMIATDSATGINVITICNYDVYQRTSLPDATAAATEHETDLRQTCDKTEYIKNIEEKKEPSPRSDWPTDYRERFWEAFPRKLEKKAALAILDRVRRSGAVPWARFIAAVRAYAATADPKFTKHPTTWLNKGCWDDELVGATAGPTSPTITIGSPSWNPWRAHFRDTGQDFRVKLMDKAASDDKPFTVPSEFPPGMQAA